MAPLAHVQPGDLITSQFINDLIDLLASFNTNLDSFNERLATLNAALAALNARVSALENRPEEPRDTILIERIEPPDVVYGQSINIIGGGFILNDAATKVLIDGAPAPGSRCWPRRSFRPTCRHFDTSEACRSKSVWRTGVASRRAR